MQVNNYYMSKALELAKKSYDEGEVPVGCVIVKKGVIIASGRNKRENKRNALLHAEIEAIDNACSALNNWRLVDCDLYVTLEPCPMCAGAIINSRIRKVIYGAADLRSGSCDSIVNLFSFPYNHKPEVLAGIMEKECSTMMKSFFIDIRDKRGKY